MVTDSISVEAREQGANWQVPAGATNLHICDCYGDVIEQAEVTKYGRQGAGQRTIRRMVDERLG